MSDQDNVFPFNKFAPDNLQGSEAMLAVINGLQNNLGLVLRKLEMLEQRVKELENE